MPDLPTLTVTQSQLDRIQAAFGSIAAYRAWLRQAIIDHVILVERDKLRTKLDSDIRASDAQVSNELGTIQA